MNAAFMRKPGRAEDLITWDKVAKQRSPFLIEKTIEFEKAEFESFASELFAGRDFIKENVELMRVDKNGVRHCIRVKARGETGGIGKETAKKFLFQQAAVYILGRDKTSLEKTREELISISKNAHIISADVSNPDECREAIDRVVGKEGRLDILVNSAGVFSEAPIEEMTPEDFDKVININLKGTFFMCKYAKPMLSLTKGCIVNVGSTAGITGFDECSLYCASKGGLNSLTKALAIEFAKQNVRVNIVNPDMVKTKMLDLGFERSGIRERNEYDKTHFKRHPQNLEDSRFILPEEVADSILFFASSEKAKAITGANLTIDFGMTAGFF